MTRIVLEVELDLETSYRPAREAKLTPWPGIPGDPEEIEVVCLDGLTVGGQKIKLPSDTANDLLDELLANTSLRSSILEQIREEAIAHG